jgi:hypothetical protein
MKRTIAIWAGVGLLFAAAWALHAAYVPMYRGSIHSTTWTLLALTFPAAFASMRMGFPLKLVWAIVLNVATFATAGAMIEFIRSSAHRLHESHR